MNPENPAQIESEPGHSPDRRNALRSLGAMFAAPVAAEIASATAAVAALASTACKRREEPRPMEEEVVDEYAGLTPEQQQQRLGLNNLKYASKAMEGAEQIVLGPDKSLKPKDISKILAHLLQDNEYFLRGRGMYTHFEEWVGDENLNIIAPRDDLSYIFGKYGVLVETETKNPYDVTINIYPYLGRAFNDGRPCITLEFHESEDGTWRLFSQKAAGTKMFGVTMDSDDMGGRTGVSWQESRFNNGNVLEEGYEWELGASDSKKEPVRINRFGLLEKADGVIEIPNGVTPAEDLNGELRKIVPIKPVVPRN